MERGRWQSPRRRARRADSGQDEGRLGLLGKEPGAGAMEEASMTAEEKPGRMEAVAAHPLAELLACPPTAVNLLTGSVQCLEFEAGETVFRQEDISKGIYVVISGQFQRRTERLNTRVALGQARSGELVELAAALGDGRHTYTLSALTSGSVLLLPIEALNQAFECFAPLRMRLLEELAREVSRAYLSSIATRSVPLRRRGSGSEAS